MVLSAKDEAQWVRSLPSSERGRFLACLSHNLTITGRVIALSTGDANLRLEQMRQLNEIQHRVSSYIGHMLGGDEDDRWLTVVTRYVLEPSDQELRKETVYAWTQTRRYFNPVP